MGLDWSTIDDMFTLLLFIGAFFLVRFISWREHEKSTRRGNDLFLQSVGEFNRRRSLTPRGENHVRHSRRDRARAPTITGWR